MQKFGNKKSFDQRIRALYTELKRADDLTPSPHINHLFSSLVQQVIETFNEKRVLSSREEHQLQQMCSEGEYELERYWAERIIRARSPKRELSRFPYFKNYLDLTRLEWFSFQACQFHKNHQVLFVGGGPMPLTAIVLASEFGIASTVIDNDRTAVDLARNLIHQIGLSDMISVQLADARNFKSYGAFSVIFVAALAGLVPTQKDEIFLRIREKAKKETHIIARSSWGNRKLLYRPLSQSAYRHFEPVLRVDPYTDIVNSVVIFRKI